MDRVGGLVKMSVWCTERGNQEFPEEESAHQHLYSIKGIHNRSKINAPETKIPRQLT